VPLEGWVAFGKPLDSAYLCVRGSRHACRAGAMLSRPRAAAGPCVFYLVRGDGVAPEVPSEPSPCPLAA